MNFNKNLILYSVLSLLCACSENEKEKKYLPREVTVVETPQEGGAQIDINLSITEIESSKSFSRYHILSVSKGDNLGFFLRIPNYTYDTDGYGVGIRFLSSGKESDNFLKFLFQTYSKYYILDTMTEFSFTPVTSFAYYRIESYYYGDSTSKAYSLCESPISLVLDTIQRSLVFSMEREPSNAIKQLQKESSAQNKK